MNEVKCKTMPVIHTERLCLQSIRDTDQVDMIALFTNEEIVKTYMMPMFESQDEKLRLFEGLRTMSFSEEHFVYGIYLNDKMIGFINDVEISEKEIELGYVIHPSQKNKGYATEVLKKSMEMLFASGYSIVKAGAFEENSASMRVMEKSGMTLAEQREIIEYRGKKHHCIYYKKENNLHN